MVPSNIVIFQYYEQSIMFGFIGDLSEYASIKHVATSIYFHIQYPDSLKILTI